MMKKTAGLFRQLFKSRGFRRGTRFLFWVTIGYIIYTLIMYMIAVTSAGISFWYALRFFFSLTPFEFEYAWRFFALIFLAVALGLIRYLQGKDESRDT